MPPVELPSTGQLRLQASIGTNPRDMQRVGYVNNILAASCDTCYLQAAP
jgi:hypothetical protein